MMTKKNKKVLKLKVFNIVKGIYEERYIAKAERLKEDPKRIPYKETIKCLRHYKTYNEGFNSKQRIGVRVINRVINTYLEIKMEQLLIHKRIKFPVSKASLMIHIRNNRFAPPAVFDSEKHAKQLSVFATSMTYYTKKKNFISVLKGPIFINMIIDKLKKGFRYD